MFPELDLYYTDPEHIKNDNLEDPDYLSVDDLYVDDISVDDLYVDDISVDDQSADDISDV